MRMRLLFSLLLLLLAPLSAHAQRGAGPDQWELLGEQKVGFRTDNDSIQINQNEEWFRNRGFDKLRFTAERNDVDLISLRITYLNGHVEDIPVGRKITRNSQLIVDLPGRRSYLKEIGMRYRADPRLSIGPGGISLRQALVKVYGERGGPAIAPPRPIPPVAGGWSEIDTQRFSLRNEQVVLNAGRGDGRFGQIRLRSLDDEVEIRSVRVRFRNGESQTVRINQRIGRGEETRNIDLDGIQRFIDTVTVSIEPRRRPGQGELQLIGLRRPGNEAPAGDPYATRGWQLLGQQSVGFTVDRDVINVGQNEEWFRNRGYRALHLVAERNDIHMMAVRIVYLNGYAEDIRIDRLIPVGGDVPVDLRGERSYIRSIELTYRSRPSFRGQAVLKVYGEPVRR